MTFLCKFISVALFILLFESYAGAQNKSLLEQEVSIEFAGEKMDAALAKLAKQEKFTFSYNPAIVNTNLVVQGSYIKKTLREVLTLMLGSSIQMKEKGNYIILTRSRVSSSKSIGTLPLIISGYVIHAETGEKIPEVSVYDKKSLTASISNQYGFFKIKVEKPDVENILSFNKRNFQDTMIRIPIGSTQFVNVVLMPERPTIVATAQESDLTQPPAIDSVWQKPEEELTESQLNMENIKDTLYRDYQVSLVPFVGTSAKLSGNVISDYSFNVFGGYSLGTRKVEVGGLFNIDRSDVKYAQLAGLFNLVGGSAKGFQGAGIFNITERETDAVQVAGIFNLNTKESRGVQIAGLMNIQSRDYHGSQIAGIMNIAGKKVSGTQISALINYGKNVRGSQIGFLNIADSIRGVPVGFMSIVGHGYHKIELAGDEIFYTNLAFRTGVHQFYNIFTAGMKPDDFNTPYWTVGYGIGTAPKLARWLFLNFDLTANQVSKGKFTQELNMLNKLYFGFEFQVTPKFGLTLGATLNSYLTKTTYEGYTDIFTEYKPKIVYDHDFNNNVNMKMWWGAKIGLRFL